MEGLLPGILKALHYFIINKRRLDGGFYHSYDPANLKQGRKFYTAAEIDDIMSKAETKSVESNGKFKVECK